MNDVTQKVVPLSKLTQLEPLVRATMTPNITPLRAPYESVPGGAARYLVKVVVVGHTGALPSPGPVIQDSAQLASMCKPLAHLDQEHGVVVCLDDSNRLRVVHVVAIGTRRSNMIEARDYYKVPLLTGFRRLVFVHNHPHGGTEPSDNDRGAWMNRAGIGYSLFGIEPLDDLIVAPEGWYSRSEGQAYDWANRPTRRWNPGDTPQMQRRLREARRRGEKT